MLLVCPFLQLPQYCLGDFLMFVLVSVAGLLYEYQLVIFSCRHVIIKIFKEFDRVAVSEVIVSSD